MELKKDNSHQKMDIENIIRRFKFGAFGVMAGLNFALFSGASVLPPLEVSAAEAGPNFDYNQLTEFERMQSANLPKGIGRDVLNYINEQRRKDGLPEIADEDSVIRRDLERSFRSGIIIVNKNSDLKWLNDCKNLDKLVIKFQGDKASEALDKVDFKNLGNLNELHIIVDTDEPYSRNKENTFNKENFGTILDAALLSQFTVVTKGDSKIAPEFLAQISNMPNMEGMTIDVSTEKIEYDTFGTKSKLKNLTIIGKAGNVAMTLTPGELDNLQNRGIKVTTLNDNHLKEDNSQRISEINERLDEIMKELNLSEDMSDEQKRNIIVLYIINHLEYDSFVRSKRKDLDYRKTEEYRMYKKNKFYKDGFLYGALESDSQICGNYAALFQALAERAGVESYYISTDTHAFNMVGYTDEDRKKHYRYLDVTIIDGINEVEVPHMVGKIIKRNDGNGTKYVLVPEAKEESVESVLMNYMDDQRLVERCIPYLSIEPEELEKRLGKAGKGKNIVPEGIKLTFPDSGENLSEMLVSEQEINTQSEETNEERQFDRLVEVDTGDRKYLVPMGVLAGMFLAIEFYKRKTRSREDTLSGDLEDLIEF